MAFFPPELLKCVVFLGYKDQLSNFHYAGSAFWVSRIVADDIKDTYRPAYLSTAAHVIRKIRDDGAHDRVWVRVNTKSGSETIETPLAGWRMHPDENVDIAVFKIGIGDFDHAAWALENCVVGDMLDTIDTGDRRLELGDEICFAGLFHPHAGTERNLPIVRVGTVAALREEPVMSRDGRPMDVYLVESRSIGGLSGSPVFVDVRTAKTIRPPTWGSMAGAYDPSSPGRFKLLGLVHGHFGDDIIADATADDGKEKVHINMGIAMIVPAEQIQQALAEYAAEEAIEADMFRRKNEPIIEIGEVSQQPNVTVGITTFSSDSHKK